MALYKRGIFIFFWVIFSRTCLRYFLPPQWIMDKDAITTMSLQELSDFPLDDFFDNYEQGLRRVSLWAVQRELFVVLHGATVQVCCLLFIIRHRCAVHCWASGRNVLFIVGHQAAGVLCLLLDIGCVCCLVLEIWLNVSCLLLNIRAASVLFIVGHQAASMLFIVRHQTINVLLIVVY